MSWALGIAIYLTVWWTTIFLVLPFGVHRQAKVETGNDAGAPAHHHLLIKALINTVLAGLVWLVIYYLYGSDFIVFRVQG